MIGMIRIRSKVIPTDSSFGYIEKIEDFDNTTIDSIKAKGIPNVIRFLFRSISVFILLALILQPSIAAKVFAKFTFNFFNPSEFPRD